MEPSTWDTKKANIKARILTGTYTLQANKAKFNQFEVDGTCRLCDNGVENREHFLTTCTALDAQRAPYIDQLKRVITDDHGDLVWSNLSGNSSHLAQVVIDSSMQIPNLPAFNSVKIEPITRNWCHKLHTVRMRLLKARIVTCTAWTLHVTPVSYS